MSKIRGKNNRLDAAMENILRGGRLPYIAYPRLYGSPDFLVSGRIAVFCDGSFWHGRNWGILRKKLLKGNNPDYWVPHIRANRRRDREVSRRLADMGFKVVRLWDKEIFQDPISCLERVRDV